jgi:hypothetical protein
VTKSAIQIQTAASLLKASAAAPSHSPFTAIPPPIIQTDHNLCLQPIPNPQSKITKSPQAKPHGNTTIFFTLITPKPATNHCPSQSPKPTALSQNDQNPKPNPHFEHQFPPSLTSIRSTPNLPHHR